MTLKAFSFCSIFLDPQTGQFFTNPFEYSSTVPQISNSFWQLSQTKSYAGIACSLQSLCCTHLPNRGGELRIGGLSSTPIFVGRAARPICYEVPILHQVPQALRPNGLFRSPRHKHSQRRTFFPHFRDIGQLTSASRDQDRIPESIHGKALVYHPGKRPDSCSKQVFLKPRRLVHRCRFGQGHEEDPCKHASRRRGRRFRTASGVSLVVRDTSRW